MKVVNTRIVIKKKKKKRTVPSEDTAPQEGTYPQALGVSPLPSQQCLKFPLVLASPLPIKIKI